MSESKRAWPLALIPFAVLFLALMFAGAVLQPPAVRTHNAPNQFDAQVARERFARVLGDQTPHAVDTPAEDALRERLLTEIRALGFAPEVHESFTCRPNTRYPFVMCARVRNIVFSTGPANGPAILAASHYDSVPAGPGASDDGIGVTAWLEIARILSLEQLRCRVIFLMTDGEEGGLIGAHAFAQEPVFQTVQAIVNLEARGTRGPAIFFETNSPNADAIAAFAPVARPVANSVAADIYHLLPNSTDVTTLTRPGLDVINVSIIDGLENYHTPHDTLANADLRSVQHMGDTGLDVTRRLAGAADADRAGDMVFTDIGSRLFVTMPVWLAQALLGLSVLIAFAAFWRSGAEARWRTLAAPLVGIVLAGVVSAAIGFALAFLHPGRDYGFANPEPMRAWCALVAMLGLVLAWMLLRATRKTELAESAALFWFALLGFALSLLLSGGAILFVLPLIPYALGCIVALFWKPAQSIGAIAAALVALAVWAPILYLFELSMGFAYPFALTIIAAFLSLTWIGLAVRMQGEASWRGAMAALAIGALAFAAASALTPAATRDRPQPLNINYVLSTTDNQALIVAGSSESELPAPLAGAFHAQTLIPGDSTDSWVVPTDVAPLTPPVLEWKRLTVVPNGEVTIHARLVMNGAHRAIIRLPLSEQPKRVAINGSSVDAPLISSGGDMMNIACEGRACDGAEVAITLSGEGERGEWILIGQFPGAPVPAAVAAMRARRPDSAVPIQFGDIAATVTRIRPFS